MGRRGVTAGAVLLVLVGIVGLLLMARPRQPHNVIIFVADGLRSEIVTPETAPELAAVRAEGVDFQNSHSLFPTVTTPNASAIATGHGLGDTGDFGNAMFAGEPALPFPVGALVPGMEDNTTLTRMNERYGGNFLAEDSFLAVARRAGFSTAAIGKLGPISIQDVSQRDGKGTIVIDDNTGQKAPDGIPLAPEIAKAMKAAGLAVATPDRGLNGYGGAYNMPGVHVANVQQQDWFAKVATDVILPRFKAAGKPFVLVFWSRDPDGTQHFEDDSLNTLKPGINGPTTMAGIRNASTDLGRLREALKKLGLDKTTDVVVTADHGFATISKQSQTSGAAKRSYIDVPPGFLPSGFLSIDLSEFLNKPLWSNVGLPVLLKDRFHPDGKGALIGDDPNRPMIAIGPNGGSDEIWLPHGDKALAEKIVSFLVGQDYTAAIFVKDSLGPIPGTLPTSLIRLHGSAKTPEPDIAVSFRTYADDCPKPDTCEIEVADTDNQQGQGIHGALARGDTHNFMAATGPDFKAGFVDPSPVSNADWAPTLAKALGLKMTPKGKLVGRTMSEALKDGGPTAFTRASKSSTPAAGGFITRLDYQEAGGETYFDAAGMPGRVLGLK
jgi:arylsulfatase A-like enzyme